MTTGTQIAITRKLRKLTQRDVARMLGRHESFLARVETGRRRLRPEELEAIAEVLGCDSADIKGDDD